MVFEVGDAVYTVGADDGDLAALDALAEVVRTRVG